MKNLSTKIPIFIKKDPAGFFSKAIPITLVLGTVALVGYYYRSIASEKVLLKSGAITYEIRKPIIRIKNED